MTGQGADVVSCAGLLGSLGRTPAVLQILSFQSPRWMRDSKRCEQCAGTDASASTRAAAEKAVHSLPRPKAFEARRGVQAYELLPWGLQENACEVPVPIPDSAGAVSAYGAEVGRGFRARRTGPSRYNHASAFTTLERRRASRTRARCSSPQRCAPALLSFVHGRALSLSPGQLRRSRRARTSGSQHASTRVLASSLARAGLPALARCAQRSVAQWPRCSVVVPWSSSPGRQCRVLVLAAQPRANTRAPVCCLHPSRSLILTTSPCSPLLLRTPPGHYPRRCLCQPSRRARAHTLSIPPEPTAQPSLRS